MFPELQRYITLLLKISIPLIIVAGIYFFIRYFIPLLFNVSAILLLGFSPFILALITAILIDPVVDWLEKKKGIKRGIAVAFTLTVLLIFITLILIFVISRLAIELAKLYADLPGLTRHIVNFTLQYIQDIRIFITNNPLPIEAQNALQQNIKFVIDGLTELVARTTNILIAFLTGLPGFITILIVAGLATFFISRDKTLIFKFIYGIMPKKLITPTSTVIGELSTALVGFFRAQTILISITAVQTIIGLYILGVDYALTLGIIVGLVDLLPVLGPGTVFIPWAVIHFVTGDLRFGVALLILYGILVGVRQLIEPKILAENIGLHPLATLLALYLGLKFLGVLGIIIGPFLVIVIKAMIKGFTLQK
ncbi:MAG: Sporulation integral rane protein YtvI [Peptococcaceae bacterium]|nr:Sporulation integral rane protein YtvI [Peptococcaceae bacterium]